jgi:hypothetical protein
MDGAAARGKRALLTERIEGVGTTDGGVSIGSGREASRCKEKAGWILKMVGDEESAREMCKDIEDKSSSGIIAETLNWIEKGWSEGEKANTPDWMGIRRLGERKFPTQPRRRDQGGIYGEAQFML